MHAIRQEITPPNGISHAVRLRLIPAPWRPEELPSTPPSTRVVCQLVVARSSLLRVFEVREENLGSQVDASSPEVLKSDIKVEEVDVEEGAENKAVNGVESKAETATSTGKTSCTRLFLIREHRLHGIVTGLARIRTLSSSEDDLDRLLVSFKDAKVALMEWSDAVYDLNTVSIHTYERAIQVAFSDASNHHSILRSDPASRCAALLLPHDSLAILPFYQSSSGLDLAEYQIQDPDSAYSKDMPYSPSYVLDLTNGLDDAIRNVIDFIFLPGFNNPTAAVLYQTAQTWTGRLGHTKDSTALVIITLDPLTRNYSLIARSASLPYDAFSLIPCPTMFGGVIILCANAIIHVDAAGKVTGLASSPWLSKVSHMRAPVWPGPADVEEERKLEGAQATWASDSQLLLWHASGYVREVEVVLDGRRVTTLKAGKRLGKTVCPATCCDVGEGYVLVGSEAGDSALLRVGAMAADEGRTDDDVKMEEDEEEDMEIDDDDIYGDSSVRQAKGAIARSAAPRLRLELCDTVHGHGPISDMTFGLNQQVDRMAPELIACTGSAESGAFTVFQRDVPLRVKRRLPALAGSQGIWSMRVRRSAAASSTKGAAPEQLSDLDTIIISSDASPAPGISRTISKTAGGDVQVIARLPDVTIAASAFFQHTCAMQITTTHLRVISGDGQELQVVKDTEGNKASSPIRSATISDPYVLLHRDDGSIALYVGDAGKKRIRQMRLPSRDKTSTYPSACIFNDHADIFRVVQPDSGGKPMANPLKRPSPSRDLSEVGREDDDLFSVQPQAKRPRLNDAEDVKDKSSYPEKKPANGRTHRERNHDHSRDRGHNGDKVKDKSRTRDETREKASDRKDNSRRHRETVESSRRHKDIKENGSRRRKDSKDNGPSPKHRSSANSKETAGLVDLLEEPRGTTWLVLFDSKNQLEIWSLPQMSLVFTTNLVSEFPPVLEDVLVPASPSDAVETPPMPEVEQILICPIGDDSIRLHMLVYFVTGQLVIYEAVQRAALPPDRARSTLNLRFTKVASHFVDASSHNSAQQFAPEARRTALLVRRTLIPFVTDSLGGISGVLQRGEEPHWIMATKHSGIRIYPCQSHVVHSFTPSSLFGSKTDFLMHTEEGPLMVEFHSGMSIDRELPCTQVVANRPYISAALDSYTGLLIGASSLKASFMLFDEDGYPLWAPENASLFGPQCQCSTVELIKPHPWQTLDGYEFGQNEFVNVVESVTLETPSTEGGQKDFIAVGTSVYRGEDLAVRGATYIFEIIEVVSAPDSASKDYKLKLLCRDEAKAPVTALCSMNGYLVSSMGQKIFVRAFEMDERLVGVAFMDVGVYVTSLSSLKNLLLIGDAVRSTSFVAFQEEPFKLVLLGRDERPMYTTNASFLFSAGELVIVASDDEGVLRLFDYDPQQAASIHGNRLICRTEFHGQSEHSAVLPVARRVRGEETSIPEAQLIFGTLEGSFGVIVPVANDVFKRLQLLSGQMVRSVQHIAGLNPRAFRTVRNDHLSRPLNKGILDGNLLRDFQELDMRRQAEVTKQIGTDTITVLRDLRALQHVW